MLAGSRLATTGAQQTSGSVLARPVPPPSQRPGRGAQPAVAARAVAGMETATLTLDAAGTRDAGDTRPTEAALRAALTSDICQEHVRQAITCAFRLRAACAIICSQLGFM
jgi:hypothetical protein